MKEQKVRHPVQGYGVWVAKLAEVEEILNESPVRKYAHGSYFLL